jgi:hypothetical protein
MARIERDHRKREFRHTLTRCCLVVTLGVLVAVHAVHVAHAYAPDITIAVDRQEVTVGDPIQYDLKLQYDSTLNLIAPSFGANLGPLTVLKDTTIVDGDVVEGQKLYHRRLRLAAFETGTLWIPAITGELVDSAGTPDTWQTDSLSLNVMSVLGDTDPDSADIQALKGQYEAPTTNWLWWAISAALLIAAIVAYLLYRRRQQPEDKASEPEIPPWKVAVHSLQLLRNEIDPASDGGRIWYFRLSEILRRYLDGRYGWESIDETTTEILRRLPEAPFNGEHRERVREFFQVADQIRYAKMAAKIGRPDIDWDWVRAFVEGTTPRITVDSTETSEDKLQQPEGEKPA